MGKTKKRANQGELQQRWDENFSSLQNYHAEHGDCLVPQGYDKDPTLARWVNSQRLVNRVAGASFSGYPLGSKQGMRC